MGEPMKLRLKLILILAAVALLSGLIWRYQTQRRLIVENVRASLENVLQQHLNTILRWREMRVDESAVELIRRYYSPLAKRWMEIPPEPSELETIASGLRASRLQYEFKDALFANSAGDLYFRLNPEAGALREELLQALKAAFRSKKPVLTDLYRHPRDGTVQIDQVVPFFIRKEDSEAPSGAIIYQYDASPFLNPQLFSSPVGSTEMLLVRRDGDSALYLNELRREKGSALHSRVSLSRKDVLAVKAVLGQRGLVEGRDYRGVSSMSVIESVRDTPWLILAKMDKAEVFAALRTEFYLIAAVVLLSGISLFAVAAALNPPNGKKSSSSVDIETVSRSNERYKNILDGISEGCQIINFEWRYIFINSVAARYSRRTKEDLETRTLMELFPDLVESPLFAAMRRCMNERKPQFVEMNLRNPDGTISCYAFSIQPVLEGIFMLSRDISDQKKAEAEKHRLVSAIEQSSEIVMIFDASGHIQYVNRAFEEVTGYTKDEVLGQLPPIVRSTSQDEAFYNNLWNTIHSGKQWSGSYVSRKKDGTLYTEEAVIWPILDDSGNIVSFVSVKRDITEYRALQSEREKLKSQLAQSQKMESIGRLAGGVAHDFNNMLSVILGHVQLSLDALDTTHPLFNVLQEINKAALRSAELTNQLLAFARKQAVSPKVLDLNDTVGGLLSMLHRLVRESIHLAWMPGYNLWHVKIDPSQINQILANLIINARDAIKTNGRITIETENVFLDGTHCAGHPDFVPGEYVMLSLADNGCGMDKETLEHIFEPFFTTKNIGEGTGLGLATVYGIVRQNNGCIDIYSEPGKGSTFKIYFPRHHGGDNEGKQTIRSERSKNGTETVLLVEDEIAVKDMAKRMMERMGYKVVAATTAREARRLAESYDEKIHLMIVDVVMPEMTGRELAEHINALRPGLKLLFMSGYTADVIAHHGILDEDVHFIQKPFSSKSLSAKIREVLDD